MGSHEAQAPQDEAGPPTQKGTLMEHGKVYTQALHAPHESVLADEIAIYINETIIARGGALLAINVTHQEAASPFNIFYAFITWQGSVVTWEEPDA